MVDAKIKDFFKGRRVLVTGHSGFKGAWLSLWLTMLGARVFGYALKPYTKEDIFSVSGLSGEMEHVVGDIRDFQKIKRAFDKFEPEVVFHLAAQPLVLDSYKWPRETYEVNVGGTVNVLECSRLCDSVKVIINVTSDKCYENIGKTFGYTEEDRLGGHDPYSSSKACSEIAAAAYRKSFFNPEVFHVHGKSLSSVRAGNIIGGGDWRENRIVPDCIRALRKGKPVLVRNPNAVRPWQYVLEPLRGYLCLAARMHEEPVRYCGAWNFGPGSSSEIPVSGLTDKIIRYWGSGSWEPVSCSKDFHEAVMLKLDAGKSNRDLGWRPALSIDESVERTVKWYKEKNADYDFCAGMIEEYEDRLA